jgi:transcriptional regulator with XRE-family HTH domain
MTQGDLAEAVGVERNTVSRWELGVVPRDQQTLESIARALGTTVEYLLGDEAAPNGAGSAVPSDFSPRARAFVLRFLAELTEAGAVEEELTSARNILTRPDNYTYNFDGTRQQMTDDDHLLELEAMADAIRLLLTRRRERRGLVPLALHAPTR